LHLHIKIILFSPSESGRIAWPSGHHLPWHARAILPLHWCREREQSYSTLLLWERRSSGHRHRHHQDGCTADSWNWDWDEGLLVLCLSIDYPLI